MINALMIASVILANLIPCKQVFDQAVAVHMKEGRSVVGTQIVPSGMILFFAETMDDKEVHALVFLGSEDVVLTGGLFNLQGKCTAETGQHVSYFTSKLLVK